MSLRRMARARSSRRAPRRSSRCCARGSTRGSSRRCAEPRSADGAGGARSTSRPTCARPGCAPRTRVASSQRRAGRYQRRRVRELAARVARSATRRSRCSIRRRSPTRPRSRRLPALLAGRVAPALRRRRGDRARRAREPPARAARARGARPRARRAPRASHPRRRLRRGQRARGAARALPRRARPRRRARAAPSPSARASACARPRCTAAVRSGPATCSREDLPAGDWDLALLNQVLHYCGTASATSLLRARCEAPRPGRRARDPDARPARTAPSRGSRGTAASGALFDLFLRAHENLFGLPDPTDLQVRLRAAGFARVGSVSIVPGGALRYVWAARGRAS